MLFAAVAFIALQPRAARSDEVAAFLDEQGLHELLATHLEQRLLLANDEEQRAIVSRLAGLYAMLLESEVASEARSEIESRAQALLTKADPDDVVELRITLSQASYRQVEKIAERHRLRSARSDEVAQAAQLARDLVSQLEPLRVVVTNRRDEALRKLGRASGSESIVLAEVAEKENRLADQSSYLLAWTRYYVTWLTGDKAMAEGAEPLFASLLATENPKPAPEDVSVDLRANESVARAILGMALCRSITRSQTAALQWIALLDHERTADVVRKEAPAWRLAILLEHGDFPAVIRMLESLDGGFDAAPTPWLRLIAAWSLEDETQMIEAAKLARQSMAALAARGELDQLLDLADRYGTDALGSAGFAPLYVQAVLAFQQVRADHPGSKPAIDAATQRRFAEIGERFSRAFAEKDASLYPSASANALLLSAWCHYFESAFLEAAEGFEKAAAQPGTVDPAEAMWMAIVCMEYVVTARENVPLARRMAELMDRYLEQYPAGKHVPELLLRKSYAAENDGTAMIESLLRIPPDNPTYRSARYRAASLLYRQYRSAHSADRSRLGREFIAVLQPMLADELKTVRAKMNDGTSNDAGEAKQRLLTQCRQLLDAATSPDVLDAQAARESIEIVDGLLSESTAAPDELIAEIDCRRVQVHLMRGMTQDAQAAADALWNADPDSPWTRLATRAVFRDLLLGRPSSDFINTDKALLERIVRYGGRVIQEFAGDENAFERSDTLTFHVIVAESSYELWRRSGDDERAGAALYLFERLLTARPDDARFLRAAAELAHARGQYDRSLECWRTLLAGLPQGSDAWYEAKYHQVETLAKIDRARAIEVLRQHVQLEGGFGPEPWGTKLAELDAALNRESGAVPEESSP